MTIDEHGIHNTASIYRAALAPGRDLQPHTPQPHPTKDESPTNNANNKRLSTSPPQQYAVDQIVGYEGNGVASATKSDDTNKILQTVHFCLRQT